MQTIYLFIVATGICRLDQLPGLGPHTPTPNPTPAHGCALECTHVHTHTKCSRHLVQMDFINKASSGEGIVAS